MAVMPMFPLGSVLLPGALLPLHVFENRYRTMMVDILADDVNPPEFGVVLITRGSEAGGGDERAIVATSARILDMHVTEDGRYMLAAVGTDRLKVNAWLPDDPYPVADVEVWVDEDADDLDERRDELTARVRQLHERVDDVIALAAELGDETAAPTEISDDPLLATYHLAALAPLGPADQFRLLATPGLRERLDVLDAVLDDATAVLKFRGS